MDQKVADISYIPNGRRLDVDKKQFSDRKKKCSFSYVTVNKYMRKVIVILHVEQSIHEKKSKDLKMRNGRN